MPPPSDGGGAVSAAASMRSSATVLDKATRALLPRLGAGAGGPDDRCLNLPGVQGLGTGAGQPTLCLAGGAGGPATCTATRALCFKTACGADGVLSVVIGGIGGGRAVQLACPTGSTVNLGAKLAGRYASGYLSCPDNAAVCRSLQCGVCDPAGGFCSFATGRCTCYLERTGLGCATPVTRAQAASSSAPSASASAPSASSAAAPSASASLSLSASTSGWGGLLG
jgi:hypothetical protein